jgi:hypothetical protein
MLAELLAEDGAAPKQRRAAGAVGQLAQRELLTRAYGFQFDEGAADGHGLAAAVDFVTAFGTAPLVDAEQGAGHGAGPKSRPKSHKQAVPDNAPAHARWRSAAILGQHGASAAHSYLLYVLEYVLEG